MKVPKACRISDCMNRKAHGDLIVACYSPEWGKWLTSGRPGLAEVRELDMHDDAYQFVPRTFNTIADAVDAIQQYGVKNRTYRVQDEYHYYAKIKKA